MVHKTLSELITALERGTKLHIAVAFLKNYGNSMTRCAHSQVIHDRPVCAATKTTREGLAACYRCRMTVQHAVIHRKKPMEGYCTKGVYEYCHPVIWEDRVVAIIFVGNVLTEDQSQRQRLLRHVEPDLLETMEQRFSREECRETALILDSYIRLLLDRYGTEGTEEYDPLVENIKSFIRENTAYDFTVEDLAQRFGYNPKYLGRLFAQHAGCTVKQFCTSIRVNKAKELLTKTNLSIADIARQVGYDYVTYFDRVFLEATKLSPGQYRAATKPPKQNL